ncbi:hypothetical protein D3C77_766040 [compost metagenome]
MRMKMNGMAVRITAVLRVLSEALMYSIASGSTASIRHQNRRRLGDGSWPSRRLRVLVAATV